MTRTNARSYSGLVYGNFTLLLTGDSGHASEERLLRTGQPLAAAGDQSRPSRQRRQHRTRLHRSSRVRRRRHTGRARTTATATPTPTCSNACRGRSSCATTSTAASISAATANRCGSKTGKRGDFRDCYRRRPDADALEAAARGGIPWRRARRPRRVVRRPSRFRVEQGRGAQPRGLRPAGMLPAVHPTHPTATSETTHRRS